MKTVKATAPIIDYDADRRETVVINRGDTGTLSDRLAAVHADRWVPADPAGDGDAPEDLPEPEPHDGGAFEEGESFEMKHVGGGWYEITGPGLGEPEKVHGRDDARARIAELAAGDDDAPA